MSVEVFVMVVLAVPVFVIVIFTVSVFVVAVVKVTVLDFVVVTVFVFVTAATTQSSSVNAVQKRDRCITGTSLLEQLVLRICHRNSHEGSAAGHFILPFLPLWPNTPRHRRLILRWSADEAGRVVLEPRPIFGATGYRQEAIPRME